MKMEGFFSVDRTARENPLRHRALFPFVLDGDRTPSRLDPFGSSDRKMEYYFLGEEGRDEATGYLFLEFQKRISR